MKKISVTKLSELVQEKRNELKITQEQLGVLTGINRQIIGRLELGKFIPSLSQLELIFKSLNINFDDVLVEEDTEDIFVAMRGKARTQQERECVEKMISMLLCLKKHEVLRRKLYVQQN